MLKPQWLCQFPRKLATAAPAKLSRDLSASCGRDPARRHESLEAGPLVQLQRLKQLTGLADGVRSGAERG